MTDDTEEPTDVTCDSEIARLGELERRIAELTAERDAARAEADRLNGEKHRAYEYRASRAAETEAAYREGWWAGAGMDPNQTGVAEGNIGIDLHADWDASQAKENLEVVK